MGATMAVLGAGSWGTALAWLLARSVVAERRLAVACRSVAALPTLDMTLVTFSAIATFAVSRDQFSIGPR